MLGGEIYIYDIHVASCRSPTGTGGSGGGGGGVFSQQTVISIERLSEHPEFMFFPIVLPINRELLACRWMRDFIFRFPPLHHMNKLGPHTICACRYPRAPRAGRICCVWAMWHTGHTETCEATATMYTYGVHFRWVVLTGSCERIMCKSFLVEQPFSLGC